MNQLSFSAFIKFVFHHSADLFLAVFYSAVAVFYTVLIKSRAAQGGGCQIVHQGRRFELHWWNHLVFRFMRILIWLFCVSRVFFPEVDALAFIFPIAESALIRTTGIAILALGFVFVLASNLALSASWRSGIDSDAPESLKQTGLYGRSRNPIFIGVLVGQIGFFLSLPSGFTLFCLIVGVVSINVQIHLEESHLRQKFPIVFEEYCRLVPRWL